MICINRFLALAALSTTLFLAGCGGGGMGGPTNGNFTFQTDWSNQNGGGITGMSERVSLFDNHDALKASAVVDQTGTGLQQVTFPSVALGDYHLNVVLFSQHNLGGVQTGTLDAAVHFVGSLTFSSAVGVSPTSLRVSPNTATVSIPKTQQFYATGYGQNGKAVFTDPATFSWDVLGGVGTVGSTGLFSATTAGSGSVRVSQSGTGLTAAAAVTVPQFNTHTGKWTVLVYINAANDLSQFSLLNFNQMERVAANPDVRFVVQWKQVPSLGFPAAFNGTRRYVAQPNVTGPTNGELVQDLGQGVDMGSAQTLQDFIAWGKTFYPAQRYCVVIWNHGNGWRRSPGDFKTTRGVSYDDEFHTSINTWELSQALGNGQNDILAWDASLMQMAEVAYEIQAQAKYVVGSEESPPAAGYPYDTVFSKFRDNPDDTSANLSKSFVDGMLAAYGGTSSNITQSVLDSSKLPALGAAISTLGDALIANRSSLTSLIPAVRNAAQSYSKTNVRIYEDLYDLCLRIESGTSIPQVTAASTAVRAAITQAIVWEGHNVNSPNSHGVSIDFSNAMNFLAQQNSGTTEQQDYQLLRLGQDTHWDEWLSVAP